MLFFFIIVTNIKCLLICSMFLCIWFLKEFYPNLWITQRHQLEPYNLLYFNFVLKFQSFINNNRACRNINPIQISINIIKLLFSFYCSCQDVYMLSFLVDLSDSYQYSSSVVISIILFYNLETKWSESFYFAL